jgi:bifunctional NMN adenylyltransferase/nudix hydrolase
MAHDYNVAVFIGRFQPFHHGHLAVILEGLERADHMVVLVGSSGSPRCHRNPFTFNERSQMIRESIPGHLRNRIRIKPLEDAAYNDSKWIHGVQSNVTRSAWEFGYTNEPSTALIGHSKDHSSYYLKLFPQWDSIEVPNYKNMNSTQIRNSYFSNIAEMWLSDCDGHKIGDLPQDHIVTPEVRRFLMEFLATPAYKMIKDEYEFILKYRASWAVAPYAPTFVTVDAVVVQSGHVLAIRRGAIPGKGLWAMPGGFIDQNERIRDAVIRELREETGIKVPDPVLRGSVIAQDVFDDPNRSARGRTITHAFLIKLKDDAALPRVKGMDDADKARWIPISELNVSDFFEDHFFIIQNMLARI